MKGNEDEGRGARGGGACRGEGGSTEGTGFASFAKTLTSAGGIGGGTGGVDVGGMRGGAGIVDGGGGVGPGSGTTDDGGGGGGTGGGGSGGSMVENRMEFGSVFGCG